MQDTVFDFQKDVIEASKTIPVVVDFWAEWCGPCRILGPILEKLADEADEKWRLVKVNTEEHPQVARQYRIQSIPAVKMFSGGQVVAEFIGALPETQVRKWLADNLPTRAKTLLADAMAALEASHIAKAKELLNEVLQDEPSNSEARVRLAELLFDTDPGRAVELVSDVPEEDPLGNNADAIRTLATLIGDYDALVAKASENKNPAWPPYLAGIEALKNRNSEGALLNWIDALSLDRNLNDDGPRKACVALFTRLGQEHELTRKHHRAFTSALF